MAHEWCEYDDFVLHELANGKNLAIHVKVSQMSPKDRRKDWSAAGNVRLSTTDDPGTVGVEITGPGYDWRADVFANHGYRMVADPALVYKPGATVVFVLKAA